jgi:phosphoribosylformylglycinamidine (FGAM) synthase-like enzyme
MAVDEALRNVVCVGADPERTAILDNFCWPKVDTEESLGALVRACRGASDAALAYGLPFISGKDSLNNEFSMSAEEAERVGLPAQLAIPHTLLISALGIVDDVNRCVTMDLKEPGNSLVYSCAVGALDGLEKAHAVHRHVASLIASGRVYAAHDISDGGLEEAVAEMCIASGLGAAIEVNDNLFVYLSAPLATAYILEMNEQDARESGLSIVGRVEEVPRLRISRTGGDLIDLAVADLADAWRSPLARGGGR